MSGPPDSHDLVRQLAVLEERINTNQAEYAGAAERMRAYMAKRDSDMAKQDKANTRRIVAAITVAVIVILGVAALMIAPA